MSILSTLNRFHTLFLCFLVDFKQVNTGWTIFQVIGPVSLWTLIISASCIDYALLNALHKEWSFPLRISSVNVTKSPKLTAELVTFTEEIIHEKLYFLCSDIFCSAVKSNINPIEIVLNHFCARAYLGPYQKLL